MNQIFDKINEITHDRVDSIIFVQSNNVKYIVRDPKCILINNLLIYEGKGYLLDWYDLEENKIKIGYLKEYDIPDTVIEMLREAQEDNIDYTEPPIFQLYYLLKKYPVNFIKVLDVEDEDEIEDV